MLRVATDENFDGRVLRALLARIPGLDVARVQDTEAAGAEDPDLLAWAGREGRVLLTRDMKTMARHVHDALDAGRTVPGVIVIRAAPIAQVIEDLVLAVSVFDPEDLRDQVIYLPL